MKFRFFSFIQFASECVIRAIHSVARVVIWPVQQLRAWAWVKATAANLETCNARQVARSRFV